MAEISVPNPVIAEMRKRIALQLMAQKQLLAKMAQQRMAQQLLAQQQQLSPISDLQAQMKQIAADSAARINQNWPAQQQQQDTDDQRDDPLKGLSMQLR